MVNEYELTVRVKLGPDGLSLCGENIEMDEVKRLERQIQLMEAASREISAREEEVKGLVRRMTEIIRELEVLRTQIAEGFPDGFEEADLY